MTARHSTLFTLESGQSGLGFSTTQRDAAQVCAENREAVLELAPDGRVMRMPPVGGETSLRNAALTLQLAQFVSHSGGWVAFASSTGFRLPDGSLLSPDASLVRREPWQALTPIQRAVEIWPAAEAGCTNEPRRIEQAEVLDGGPEFPGLRVELGEIWEV